MGEGFFGQDKHEKCQDFVTYYGTNTEIICANNLTPSTKTAFDQDIPTKGLCISEVQSFPFLLPNLGK
jgi:hypothetical protein